MKLPSLPARLLGGFIVTVIVLQSVLAPRLAADTPAPDKVAGAKPVWLGEFSLSARESYDDNVLAVAGLGLQPQSSWVSAVSFKLGLNLVPLLDDKNIQTFTLSYQPEVVTYASASEESYTAHRVGTVIKVKSDAVTFSFDNNFLYNDGSKDAPVYALNQLAGAAAEQNDKFRNNYAHSLARERRNQYQDRYNTVLQYSQGSWFIRAASSMVFIDMNTVKHNTGAAPYKGYQNYPDRYDLNAGTDVGWKISPDVALTLGWRAGYQYQQQFSPGVNADQHFSSNHYQRVLLGLEGKPAKWLSLKLSAGPDFRSYNPLAATNSLSTTRWYGEASATATLAPDKSLTFTGKQWMFVASTGLVPYVDSTWTLAYHWSVDKQWGLDLGAKILEANYTMGNEVTGGAPSLRDDLDYNLSAGVTYALSKQCSLNAAYNHDIGRNGLSTLPANLQAAYREFDHNVVSLGLQYKF